ncbi:MAG: glycosyl hydrolase family 28-related protein [Planctomycetota bacterium]|jgi:hypothetical protein
MRTRLSQRDILPTTVRKRHQVFKEKSPFVVVSPVGGEGDFVNIQKAVDVVRKLGGGIIYIKEGTYTITSNVALYENISLIGENVKTTILDFNKTSSSLRGGIYTPGYPAYPSAYRRNIHIKNLRIMNSIASSDGAIDFYQVKNGSIENCHFERNWNSTNSFGIDIRIRQCHNISARNCRSEYGGWLLYGYSIGLNYYTRIMNCYSENSNKGLVEVPGSYAVISNNYISSGAGKVIDLSVGGIGARVTNNFILDGTTIGININTPNTTIANNYISNQTHGIFLGEHADSTSISGNSIIGLNDGYSGVYLNAGADGTIIKNNTFQGGSGSTGVTISDASCDQSIVAANLFDVDTDVTDSGTNTIEEHNGSL